MNNETHHFDGLHINEDGSVVAIAGETLVVVPLSTAEMREFASMLQRAAAHIDKKQTIRPGEGIIVEAALDSDEQIAVQRESARG